MMQGFQVVLSGVPRKICFMFFEKGGENRGVEGRRKDGEQDSENLSS